ncbi:MAG TPA: dephospho-CoA kinase [Segeticoccus sp.]|uniref:dephospho-CoA kinase n=1 Tax=Segeticoccus sp. TaxID=2706531 RepID=UPI002D7F8326|nr:dephospho-CoA kinase [Segeticoccus sp.]HET8599342.1 dephospho-CoA kinase [Segeticoccus sp.]
MLRVGLTGGIGAGKSTAAVRLRELGALVVDADVLAREVVAPGSEGLAAVAERFGADVLTADGSLDRAALGTLVFDDAAARRDLELITHPRIAARTRELVAAAAADQVVVHDVPLLVEKGMGPDYHLVLVVGAAEDVRVERLVRDRGMSDVEARARIRSQVDDAQRRRAADVWLDNNGAPERLRDAVDALWRERLVPFEQNVRAGIRARRPEVPTLVPYDETWPTQAARLVARLGRVLGDRVVAVEHVGSTSVPGLLAKDVIDLQVEVARLEEADRPAFVRDLTAAGFPRSRGILGDRPKPSVPDPRQWRKRFHGSSDPGRVVHVHVREQGSVGARFALLFRDWLRADPSAREEYAGTKRRLAAAHATTSDYAAAKEPWFDSACPRAEEWARENGWEAPR